MNHHNTLRSPHHENGEPAEGRPLEYVLGNPELPIADYREEIVSAVDTSQAVVITAETGAGKSTQVPQFLAENGYEVIVTQPRIVAARTLAERVQEEVGEEFAGFVGYRTARERGDSPENQILYVTDGLQTVRELAGQGVGKKQVLVLDEVHEWNENMEVLVAWAKKRLAEDPNFKVVTMSATMEADSLAAYFAGDDEREVPVIEAPGRTFEVEKTEGGDVATEAIRLAREGKNTLVFVPGKAEINEVIAELERANIAGATILPLHGQLDKEDQRRVFQSYGGVKVIVATNVAQTSITIDDIDAVVDSGLERRKEVKNGVEGLYIRPTSQADCLQRAGRAGRTKDGEYVLARLGSERFVSFADREPYGTPEIMRTRLDGTVLRMATSGFDASEVEFYHQPELSEIVVAKQRLEKLGALTEDGQVTRVGRQMERMPVESHYARMMVEARQYGPEVQLQLAAMLSAVESGGLTYSGKNSTRRWQQFTSNESLIVSDMLVQIDVFAHAQNMSQNQLRDNDIIAKNLSKANGVFRQLRHIEGLKNVDLQHVDKEQREQLIRCIVAGMVDNLYIQNRQGGDYRSADGEDRELSNRSGIGRAGMIVGMPFNLGIKTRYGNETLKLIESATVVPSVDMLREVAPQLYREESTGKFKVALDGRIVEEVNVTFNGVTIKNEADRATQPSPERTSFIINELFQRHDKSRALLGVQKQLTELQSKTDRPLPIFPEGGARALIASLLSLEVDSVADARGLVPDIKLSDIVPQNEIDTINREYEAIQAEEAAQAEVERIKLEAEQKAEQARRREQERQEYEARKQAEAEQQARAAAERKRQEEERQAELAKRRAEEERQRAEAAVQRERDLRELAPIFDDIIPPEYYYDDAGERHERPQEVTEAALALARGIRDFAEGAAEEAGLNWALSLLQETYSAPYGRARQLADLKVNLPKAAAGLNFQRARDLNAYLSGAISWLEKLQAEQVIESGVVEQPEPEIPEGMGVDEMMALLQEKINGKRL